MKTLVAILLLIPTFAFSQSFPSYEAVIKAFFSRYETNLEPPLVLQFQKKKAGWFTVEEDYSKPDNPQNPQLFWSATDGQYQSLNYEAPADTAADAIEAAADEYLRRNAFDIYNYDHNSFFGYIGWDWDVINEHGSSNNLTDLQLESLGRAYSSYANGFISNQFGFHFLNNDNDRSLLHDSIAISVTRKDKFISYISKGIDAYRRLMIQQPGYETRVGPIDLKHANEHVFAYHVLSIAGFEKEALAFLKPGLYSDSMITEAKKWLTPTAPKAILITGGDNDTYPLFYLQETEKLRKDVTIINLSLLGRRRMIAHLLKRNKGLFNTTRAAMMKKEFDIAFYDNKPCKTPLTIAAFLQSMRNAKPKATKGNAIVGASDPLGFSCREIYKQVSPAAAAKLFKGKPLVSKMQFSLYRYVTLSDLMLLDLIETNLYTRPIYFTFEPMVLDIEKYFRAKEELFQLMPVKN